MIAPDPERSLGQMMRGVRMVGATHDGVERAYCFHRVCQVAFDDPILARLAEGAG